MDVTKTGNGEQGMANGKWEMGNGNGNGKWDMENGKWEMGNGKWEIVISDINISWCIVANTMTHVGFSLAV